jgi:hypothetical protein
MSTPQSYIWHTLMEIIEGVWFVSEGSTPFFLYENWPAKCYDSVTEPFLFNYKICPRGRILHLYRVLFYCLYMSLCIIVSKPEFSCI